MSCNEVTNLEQLLDRVCQAGADRDRVSVDHVLDAVGRRSFGPILLVAGLITLAPVIGDIPGVPVMIGLLVLLIAIQLLFHREHLWLPRWLLRKSASRNKLEKAVQKSRRAAQAIDKLVRPRLQVFTKGRSANLILTVCVLISAATPLMEFVPFSANLAGAALAAFGLSLVAHDGLLALLAFAFTAAVVTAVVLGIG